MPKLSEAVFGIRQEDIGGEQITVTSADVPVDVLSASIDPNSTPQSRNTFRGNQTPQGVCPTIQTTTYGISYPLLGPANDATEPAISQLMRACFFTSTAARRLPATIGGTLFPGELGLIGPAGGPYDANRRCRILRRTIATDTQVYFVMLEGAEPTATDEIQGQTSTNLATATAVPEDGGWLFRPADPDVIDESTPSGTNVHLSSMTMYSGDERWATRGGLGNWSAEIPGTGFTTFSHTLTGVNADSYHASGSTIAPATFPEDGQTLPKFQGEPVQIIDDSNAIFSAVGVENISISAPYAITPILSAGSTRGLFSMDMDRFNNPVTATFAINQIPTTTRNLFDDHYYLDTARVSASWTIGADGPVGGPRWTMTMPTAQITAIPVAGGPADRVQYTLTLTAVSTDARGDFFILFHTD